MKATAAIREQHSPIWDYSTEWPSLLVTNARSGGTIFLQEEELYPSLVSVSLRTRPYAAISWFWIRRFPSEGQTLMAVFAVSSDVAATWPKRVSCFVRFVPHFAIYTSASMWNIVSTTSMQRSTRSLCPYAPALVSFSTFDWGRARVLFFNTSMLSRWFLWRKLNTQHFIFDLFGSIYMSGNVSLKQPLGRWNHANSKSDAAHLKASIKFISIKRMAADNKCTKQVPVR